MRIDAVILDMDGLMLDTESVYRHAWQTASAELGHVLDDTWYLTLIGLPNEECERKLLAQFGADYPIDEFRTRWAELWRRTVVDVGVPLKPGLNEFLALVEGENLPMAIATSSVREYAELSLHHAGLGGRIKTIVTGDQITLRKPAPDIYLEAAQRLGVRPVACVAVEDSDVGALAASRAGMLTFLVPDLKPPNAEAIAAAHRVFGSLHEARDFLAALLSER